MDRTERRLTVVWGIMVALTLSSYMSSTSWFDGLQAGSAAVIAFAWIKVRFVVMDFMEVKSAPVALRLILEAWIIGLAATLILLTH